MEFQHLVAPTYKELFIQEIETGILSGKLPIGSKLPTERELSKQMGVSRAVINGGINELVQKGFLEVIPRVGAYVSDYKRRGKLETLQIILEYHNGHFDKKTLASIFEVCDSSMQHVARLAAENNNAETIKELRDQYKLLSATSTAKEFAETNAEFYHLLAIASDNIMYPFKVESYRPLYYVIIKLFYKYASPEVIEMSLGWIEKLIDGIESGDGDQAADCITQINKLGHACLQEFCCTDK
ncbi:MAG: GntR family transcriptional regulator [Clostridiales Family XIII bacterium]|jgi:DNA-binding FadR family transcriptional regulator|nr:GntR family transcriptional regulator [Clostridiales Family XIII bacterium]